MRVASSAALAGPGRSATWLDGEGQARAGEVASPRTHTRSEASFDAALHTFASVACVSNARAPVSLSTCLSLAPLVCGPSGTATAPRRHTACRAAT